MSLGSYFAGNFLSTTGNIKSVSVAGDFTGGNTNSAAQDIGSISIAGSITNGTEISAAGGVIDSLVVKGSIEGSCAVGTKFAFDSAKIGGDLGGTLFSSAGSIGSVTVAGDMTQGSAITAGEGSIGSVTVGGSVSGALILAGIEAANTQAIKIGSINVKGDWIASSVSAGFKDTNNNGYGNDDDSLAALSGKIGSIIIGGEVIGTVTPTTDHFGFDAQDISVFKLGGNTIQVGSTPEDITLSYNTGGDVAIHIAQM